MSGRDTTWGQHIRVLTFLKFFNRATEEHTREPIVAHNSSEDVVWCKEDPFWMRNVQLWNFGVFLKHSYGSERAINSPNKMLDKFEMVRDTRNMSMNHSHETGVALSDSVNKNCMKRPLAED